MDKVKLYAQERLDLDDTRALQSLVYDYVQEALGGVFGHVRGALSAPIITQTENSGNPYIELSEFQFVTSTPVESSAKSVSFPSAGLAFTQFKSVVATYNPTEESSTQISIDTARTFYQDYVGAFLWVRPIYVDTDTATRVKWDVSQGTDVTFADETRESQRVEFRIQTVEPTYTSSENKWSAIAKITGWTDADNTNSLAQWQILSAYEHDASRQFMGTLSADSLERSKVSLDGVMNALPLYPMEQSRSYRGFGLADQVAMLRYKIAQMQGYGTNDPSTTPTNLNWYNAPLVSLNGIQTAHAVRTSQLVPIVSVNIKATYIVGASAYEYQMMDITRRIGVEQIRASTIRSNRVSIEFTSALLSEDWYVRHVSCSQYMYREGSNNQFDYNRVNFQVERFTPTAKLTETTEYRLDDYSTTSGRGVTIELLPLHTTNEEAISDQQNHVSVVGTESSSANRIVYFSVIVFAVHEDQY